MDLKQLHYFIAIAEEGTITAAAGRLHLTQPPLTQQLKKLEEDLNVTLFERNSRRMQLTEVGKLFLIRARQILAFSNAAEEEIRDYANGYNGTVLVGITPTAVPLILSADIADFHKGYPLISFEFLEGNTTYISELLHKGIIDIGILRSPLNTRGLGFIEKPAEAMMAVMSPDYNWSDSDYCSIHELDRKEIIIYRRYEALLTETFALYNVEPRIICKSDRSYTALRAAEAGLGIAILPASTIAMAQHKVIYKKIDEPSLETKPIAVWLPDRYLTKPVHMFLEYFKQL